MKDTFRLRNQTDLLLYQKQTIIQPPSNEFANVFPEIMKNCFDTHVNRTVFAVQPSADWIETHNAFTIMQGKISGVTDMDQSYIHA